MRDGLDMIRIAFPTSKSSFRRIGRLVCNSSEEAICSKEYSSQPFTEDSNRGNHLLR
jgi:hypothetical protein